MANHPFKEFRQTESLSQTALGQRLGLNGDGAQGLISHYENGRRRIPITVAYKFITLAKGSGLEVSLEDIYPPPVGHKNNM